MIQIYHNPRCGKSRSALKILTENGVEHEVKLYLQESPSFDELKGVLVKLNMRPWDLIRKGEKIYKEQFKGQEKTDDEWISAMVEHPILIERPIVINNDQAVVARPPEKTLEVL